VDFEKKYLAEIEEMRAAVRAKIARFDPKSSATDEFRVTFEYVRTNFAHILDVTERRENIELATQAMEELLINRNIDHVPTYFPELSDHIELHDSTGVLNGVAAGRTYMFAGFHTGPYWSIVQKLVALGAKITVLLPPSLAHKEPEILETYHALNARHRRGADLKFLRIDKSNFLMQVRADTHAGRQLLLFVDGYGGYQASPNKKDVVLKFLNCELSVKTTAPRLAEIVGLPIVTFNAARLNGTKRLLYIAGPFNPDAADRKSSIDHTSIVQSIFQCLEARLKIAPARWEGWVYFHTFFSKGFLNTLRVRSANSERFAEPSERFFVQGTNDQRLLVDRATYQGYRIKDRQTVPG